jgi:serine/threonine protein kinase
MASNTRTSEAIIHRDLKPANVKITPEGVGKKPPAELHVVVNWSDELKARRGAARN